MDAIREWLTIERMMVGDFNPNHDPDNGQFASGSVAQTEADILSEANTQYIEQDSTSVIGGWGMHADLTDYLKRKGVSDKTLAEIDSLIDGHKNGGIWQTDADLALGNHMTMHDEIGAALKHRADFEEALYKRWRDTHQNSSQLQNGELKLYRKGPRKTGVESWTVSEDGADFGYGGIGYDHTTTLESLLHSGYRVLGGFGTMTGGPGEAEITVIKE